MHAYRDSVMKSLLTLATAAVFTLSASPQLAAHCQIPCGIYTDDTVLKDLDTHQATISKAMAQINELSKNPAKNANQIARWVANKEQHATRIQITMMEYFLAQRIKLAEAEINQDAYLKKLTLAHQIIVYAMKCKQSTDISDSANLQQAIGHFTWAYTEK